MPKLISRERAIELGLKRYFTGLVCIHGHIAERYVNHNSCCACHVMRLRSRRGHHTPTMARRKRKVAPQVAWSEFITPPTRAQLMAGR